VHDVVKAVDTVNRDASKESIEAADAVAISFPFTIL